MASMAMPILSFLPCTAITPHTTLLSLPTKFRHSHLGIKLKLLPRLHAYSLVFSYACTDIFSCSSSSARQTGLIRAYMEKPDPFKELTERVIGAMPILGLLYRLVNSEGGVGGDRIQLPEFCNRVQNRSTPQASRAFYEFRERHAKTGNARFVLLWCWVAAVGAGLVKSEEIMLGASRLRVSFDMQYEEDNFNILMDEASAKRAKSKTLLPEIPMEARAERALDAIIKCCLGSDVIEEEEDARLLTTILSAVFPTADEAEIEKIMWSRIKQSSADQETSQEIEEQNKETSVLEQDTETVYI